MDAPLESYKYHRNCSLETCKKLFGTNYKRKEFCKDSHRIIFHDMKRRKTSILYKRMAKLERDLKKLAMEIDQSMKKAVKETGRLTVFLSPKKGGDHKAEKKKTKG